MSSISNMLDSGTWFPPTTYENLTEGIRSLVDLLRHCELDEKQADLAVRWIREATKILETYAGHE